MDLELKRYPAGRYRPPSEITQEDIDVWIETIEAFPKRLRDVLSGLPEVQLESRYRPEGWTIRQVIHHVADSHLNSYIRFKWALTEDHPTIKAYNQELWAERPDAREGQVEMSLRLLEGLHERWTYVLRTIGAEEWNRKLHHPEMKRDLTLAWMLGLYDWHCRHHLAHIELAIHAPAPLI